MTIPIPEGVRELLDAPNYVHLSTLRANGSPRNWHAAELTRFREFRPRSLAMIARARAHMPNGVPMAWMAQDNDQPVYIESGSGLAFTDLDGFSYIDVNASDMAMFCGHVHPAIVAAVQAQATRSTQFLLPTQASVEVAELLAGRYPVPQWQFTLSATQANAEAIRLARAVTGRGVRRWSPATSRWS
jgi:glutamate-1-semialdehyde 2,1-aminomutase